jgi:hypothetical protein
MMYHYCKLCGECLLLARTGRMYHKIKIFQCRLCEEYTLWVDADNKPDVEWLTVNNFNLVIVVKTQQAFVRSINENDSTNRMYPHFLLNELTHELAVQWVNKLRLYSIFQ